MDVLVTIIVSIIGSGVLNTIITHVLSVREKRKQNDDDIILGLRILMKYQLQTLCEKYISQGWIYEDDLKDPIEMHKYYKESLDGNGFFDLLMQKVTNLDVKVERGE